MNPRADHAAAIIAAADVRRVSSHDHHLAAGRDGQACNSQAHPATRTLILNREPQPATNGNPSGSIPPAPHRRV
jgi:hypothetical protein